MKKYKMMFALVVGLIFTTHIASACGDYGMYRLQYMDVQEFLSYDQVSIGFIKGVEAHPQDSNHKFFQVQLQENFRGAGPKGSVIMVDGNKNWRLHNAQVGDKILLFAQVEKGRFVADQSLSLVVPSAAQLQRNLAVVQEKHRANTMNWHKQEEENMKQVYQRLRTLDDQIVEGVNELKSGDKLTKRFHVVNGKLSGEFLAFDTRGNVRLKGQYAEGRRVGTWKYFSNGELHYQEEFGSADESLVHLKCY